MRRDLDGIRGMGSFWSIGRGCIGRFRGGFGRRGVGLFMGDMGGGSSRRLLSLCLRSVSVGSKRGSFSAPNSVKNSRPRSPKAQN